MRKMDFLSRVGNWIYLFKRRNQTIKFDSREQGINWIKSALYVSQCYKKKSWTRNQLAKHIRDIHRQYPYKIIDYSEAKKMYDEYPLMKGALDYDKLVERVKRGVNLYIKYFRTNYPVRGEKYESYYINGYYHKPNSIVQLYWNEERQQIRQKYYDCEMGFNLNRDEIKMCRFATKKEIKFYWERRNQYDYLKSCKEMIYNELCKINEEINAI